MKLSEELVARGFIHQHTADTLADIVDGEKRVVYHGIDPTADSAHAGNMVVWLLLRHLTEAGHTVLFLVGGGTGMIGDPKPDSERTLQTSEVISHNVEKIKQQASRLVGETQVEFVNNKDWLLEQGLVEFLRDIGKHFTVNELIKKDAIAYRLENGTGLSYTEFAYPLLQAFDYLTLYRQHNCTLQVGGSDQWGNMVSGVDLVRRKEQAEVHAITAPLVVDKATGKKFGKSEGNAVWLDPIKTTPYQFYQFWLNVADINVIDYLKLFTFIDIEEIQKIETEWMKEPENRLAQKTLALAVTEFVHGKEIARMVCNVTKVLFEGSDLQTISAEEKTLLKESAPYMSIASGQDIVAVLVATGLAQSKREARTFVVGGAVTVAGVVCADVSYTIEGQTGELLLLRRGKKQIVVIEVQ